MRKKPFFKLDNDYLDEHPAAQIWHRIKGGNSIPSSIEKLIGTSWNKSSIYRLNNVGPGGAHVIAKRANRTSLSAERIVYELILPQIPVSQLHCYGFFQEEESDFCWLFIDEATGMPYSESIETHKITASKWLGKIHAATARMKIPGDLPRVGPRRYVSFLEFACKRIIKHIDHANLTKTNQNVLRKIVGHCDTIKSHWDEIKSFCDTIPSCLVHGDFIGKNVRILLQDNEPLLYVLDWEASGWGVPAEDIGGLDMDIYWSIIKDTDFSLNRQTLQRLSDLGLVFRYLAWIQATSVGLEYEWVEKTMQDLTLYKDKLEQACQSMGWVKHH